MRKIMHSLVINFLSSVDSPAQEGAVATIMKRRSDEDLDRLPSPAKGEKLADFVKRFDGLTKIRIPNKKKRDATAKSVYASVAKGASLTTETNGHTHIVVTDWGNGESTHGDTSWVDHHTHPWLRDGDEIVIGAASGHSHGIAKSTKKTKTPEEPNAMTDQEKKDAADAATALTKRAERAEATLALPTAQRAHFDSLGTADADAFLAKSADEREAFVKNLADENAVVYTDLSGNEFRKSDDPRMVSMAKTNDAQAKDLIAAKAINKRATLEKRVTDEIPHLPGDTATKCAMLGAIDDIPDETVREAALKSLKANNDALAKANVELGVAGTPLAGETLTAASADVELDKLTKARVAKSTTGETYEAAYAAVLDTPEGMALYEKIETLTAQ